MSAERIVGELTNSGYWYAIISRFRYARAFCHWRHWLRNLIQRLLLCGVRQMIIDNNSMTHSRSRRVLSWVTWYYPVSRSRALTWAKDKSTLQHTIQLLAQSKSQVAMLAAVWEGPIVFCSAWFPWSNQINSIGCEKLLITSLRRLFSAVASSSRNSNTRMRSPLSSTLFVRTVSKQCISQASHS